MERPSQSMMGRQESKLKTLSFSVTSNMLGFTVFLLKDAEQDSSFLLTANEI